MSTLFNMFQMIYVVPCFYAKGVTPDVFNGRVNAPSYFLKKACFKCGDKQSLILDAHKKAGIRKFPIATIIISLL